MVELWDEFEHAEKNLVYSPVNLPGPGYRDEEFQPIQNCCDCTTDCSTSCSHLVRYGKNYSMGLMLKSSVNQPIFECNTRCSCDPSRCYNRVVQFGPNPNLEIIKTDSKGFGVICKTKLRSGEYVCEYAGEIIDAITARQRFAADFQASNYILVLKEFGGSKVVSTTIVDPTVIGNIGRYLNHSCEPNLEMVPVRVDSAVPHLALFASKDIIQGEELCFDYGDTIREGKLVLVEPGEEPVNPGSADSGKEKPALLVETRTKNPISTDSDSEPGNSGVPDPGSVKPGFIKLSGIKPLIKPGASKQSSSAVSGESKPLSKTLETENCKAVIDDRSPDDTLLTEVEGTDPEYSRRSRCFCNAKNCKKWLPFNQELFL
jgi:histone-lysine N-methyltransferase SETMAR